MERVAGCNNVITLLCLHEPEITTEACRAANAMRSKQMFYGFLVEMGRADAAQAVNTDWLDVLASMACSAFIPASRIWIGKPRMLCTAKSSTAALAALRSPSCCWIGNMM